LKRRRGLGLAWRKTCDGRARPRRLGRESISSLPPDKFGYLKDGMEMKKWRGGRRKEVRIKFIESWNNVLNEECDI
jgi:hypothetical protein